jgi:hypothetical protein
MSQMPAARVEGARRHRPEQATRVPAEARDLDAVVSGAGVEYERAAVIEQ